MQDTKYLDITSGYFTKSSGLNTLLIVFLKVSRFRSVFSDLRAIYNRRDLVNVLMFSKFLENKSINGLVNSDLGQILKCGKDVYYSFKNNIKINWRKTMWDQALNCISEMNPVDMKTNISHEIPCLIADDTDIPKRGRFIEMIGKIFSHTGYKYNLGFKSLNLAYWTGNTLIHLDHSLHIESRKDGKQGLSKKELKQSYSKIRPQDSNGAKRFSECTNKKTASLISMLKRAIQKDVKAKYILVDSWFFNQALLGFILSSPLHLITRPKKNNWIYFHKDKQYTVGQLLNKYKNLKKRRKWSRKLRMTYVQIDVSFKGHPLTLCFYKAKKRGSAWQILISTHRAQSAIKIYEIYQNRWSIEVSYKELKQHFNYGKCQSRDFIGQISDNTICLMAYNFMSMYKCINEYHSIGALFEQVKQGWIRPTIMKEFWKLLLAIVSKISDIFAINRDEIMKQVINDHTFLNYFNINCLILTTET